MPSKPYSPEVQEISRAQAQRVAQNYSHCASLLIYAHTGVVADELHRRHLVSLLADLYRNVRRGRGYCLNRSQIKNLAHHIMFQKTSKKVHSYV